MSFVFDEDMYKYVDEEDLNRQFKWGSAIYLPRGYALDEIQRKEEIDLEALMDPEGERLLRWSSICCWLGK